MNFEIPSAFAYADMFWTGLMVAVGFAGGWLVGGICQS
jgi:hypothetical protein